MSRYETSFRPAIRVIRVTPDQSGVEVVLERDERQATGYEEIHGGQALESAARATVTAASGLLRVDAALSIEWVRLETPPGAPLPVVNAGVRVELGSRVEHLLGAAYAPGEPAIAAVRATLDGLTRRLARLEQSPPR